MVCVAALDGVTLLLPTGAKQRSAILSASDPEIRTKARPASPSGVAMAAMVSASMVPKSVLKLATSDRHPARSPHRVPLTAGGLSHSFSCVNNAGDWDHFLLVVGWSTD